MKLKDIITAAIASSCAFLPLTSCTDLSETVYDQVMSANYYNTKKDVISAVYRPFEHMFCCTWVIFQSEELPADQLITPTRGTWWYDGGKWEKFHRHQYDDIITGEWTSEWTEIYTGIGQCNLVLDDLAALNPADFDLTAEEFDAFRAQLRCMRAFAYIRLLNAYRNCVLTTTSDQAANELPENRKQVPPKTLFEFIESELKDFCLAALPTKAGSSGNGNIQGTFTKAAAAGLLVRLYLNAEVWIGEDRYQDCINMCDRILNGDFGTYSLAENWWEPFDWDNETCNEVIFAYPGSYSTSSWHLQNDRRTCYGRGLPYGSASYLNVSGNGERNPKYALSPSYDNSVPRKHFDYKLGMVTQKFEKYPGDLRYRQYVNTGNNTREGMFFLEGKIRNQDGTYAKNPEGQYEIYLRDQVGRFESTAEQGTINSMYDKASILGNGDFNSGLYQVKYPFYPFDGGYYIESDYVEMRLAEIIYSKAECLLRQGKDGDAGALLNSVRKRNYENFTSAIAYAGSDGGTVELTMDEMLDEWGREFLAESRRRTDLIRFGRFQDEWWDKPKDSDRHYEIFPLGQTALEQNSYLKQNPGYPDIAR